LVLVRASWTVLKNVVLTILKTQFSAFQNQFAAPMFFSSKQRLLINPQTILGIPMQSTDSGHETDNHWFTSLA
jgi:hypothetical protein